MVMLSFAVSRLERLFSEGYIQSSEHHEHKVSCNASFLEEVNVCVVFQLLDNVSSLLMLNYELLLQQSSTDERRLIKCFIIAKTTALD